MKLAIFSVLCACALAIHNYLCEHTFFNVCQALHHESFIIIFATVASLDFIKSIRKRLKR